MWLGVNAQVCPVSGFKFEPTFVGTDWVQHALKTVKPAKPAPIRACAPHRSIAAVGIVMAVLAWSRAE
jgi:hypothetical protein